VTFSRNASAGAQSPRLKNIHFGRYSRGSATVIMRAVPADRVKVAARKCFQELLIAAHDDDYVIKLYIIFSGSQPEQRSMVSVIHASANDVRLLE
jgi:hypothetical protein